MKRYSLSLLAVAAMVLAACAGSGAARPDASGNLSVEMSEYKFTPSNIELKVGQNVTITLVNKGAKDHELMIGRNVMTMNGAPNGFEKNMFADTQPMVMMGGDMNMGGMNMGGSADHAGFMVLMPKGSDNATITFTVTGDMVGEWEIGCFEDDGQHYEDGMKGKLIVSQ